MEGEKPLSMHCRQRPVANNLPPSSESTARSVRTLIGVIVCALNHLDVTGNWGQGALSVTAPNDRRRVVGNATQGSGTVLATRQQLCRVILPRARPADRAAEGRA